MSFSRELIPTVDFISLNLEFQQAAKIRGVIANVARRLNLSHEHVRQVALGDRVSRRVAVALTAELRRRKSREQRELAA
jgi:hypothetical protein